MANIVLSDQAPSGESIHFTFGSGEFDLGGSGKGSKSFSTDNRDLLANAEAHPWLSVEYPQVDSAVYERPAGIDPTKDPLSALGPNASLPFDPEAVKAAEDAKAEASGLVVGLDANKDQDKPVTTGRVAETVAAADSGDNK